MNYIRIEMCMIPQTQTYSKPIWFIDEVSGNCAKNLASRDSEREAIKRAYELAKQYNLEVIL